MRALAVSNPALTLASREELQEVVVHLLSKSQCPQYIYSQKVPAVHLLCKKVPGVYLYCLYKVTEVSRLTLSTAFSPKIPCISSGKSLCTDLVGATKVVKFCESKYQL
jgi:hypothetical protein